MKGTGTKTLLPFIIVALIIFFEPQGFKEGELASFDLYYKIAKIIITPFILFLFLCLRKKRIGLVLKLLVVYEFTCLLLTMLNKGDYVRFIGPAITVIDVAAIGELLSQDNKMMRIVAKVMCVYFRTCFLINLASIAVIKTNIFFLGIDNRWIFTYIPWIVFEYINSEAIGRKKMLYVSLILSELSLLYRQSVAAMLIIPLFLIVCLRNINAIINKSTLIYISTLLVNYALITVGLNETAMRIVNSLGKDATLSGRTLLWETVFRSEDKMIAGHGMQSEIYDKSFFSSRYGFEDTNFLQVSHAHNTYVTIIYRYGILALLLFIGIIALSIKKLANSNYIYKNICIVAMFVCILLGIFDTIDCAMFYVILGISSGLEKRK